MSIFNDEEEKRQIRQFGSDEMCPICLLPMRSEIAVLVPCRHAFCIACCTTFLRTNIDSQTMPCPVCRSLSSLADVETSTGKNLRQAQIEEREKESKMRYFDVSVKVQTVSFGDVKRARHPERDQAMTPSAKTPALFEICDSCFFQIESQAIDLQVPARYDAYLHIKRLSTFTCHEFVTVKLAQKNSNNFTSTTIDLNQALKPNAWTMLLVGSIELRQTEAQENQQDSFFLTLQADRRDWWKTGLIVDCLAVSENSSSSFFKKEYKPFFRLPRRRSGGGEDNKDTTPRQEEERFSSSSSSSRSCSIS